MLQPIDWNNLPDLDSDLIASVEESETERYTNLKRNLKDMKLTGKDLFVLQKKVFNQLKNLIQNCRPRSLTNTYTNYGKTLRRMRKLLIKKMVDSLREIVTGDSVHDWDINCSSEKSMD